LRNFEAIGNSTKMHPSYADLIVGEVQDELLSALQADGETVPAKPWPYELWRQKTFCDPHAGMVEPKAGLDM
jgi:hypothetical protein